MDRVHETTLDAEVIEQHLCHRSKAVGGAGRIRDDVIGLWVVLIVVHAHDDGDVLVLRRSGDDDLLSARIQMSFRLVRIGEQTGGFDHDVDTKLAPRKILRIAL